MARNMYMGFITTNNSVNCCRVEARQRISERGSPSHLCRRGSRGGGALDHQFFKYMWITSHGQCPRGVLVNVQEWVYFSIFRGTDDVTRTMSKGGACECPRVGAFFNFSEGG